MARNRSILVLELDGDRVLALRAVATDTRVEVDRWLSAVRPAAIAADDAPAIGRWIATELDKSDLHAQRLVVALPRAAVILKKLTVPAAISQAERINAIALQMARGMALPTSAVAADFIPLGSAEASTQVDILAAAISSERVQWWGSVAESAGLKLDRIAVAAFGAALSAASSGVTATGPALLIAPGLATTELLVLEDNQVVVARSADISRPATREDVESAAQRAAVEAKRTWMGYASSASQPLEAVHVLARGPFADALVARCRESLECPASAVGVPAWLELPPAMPEAERWAALPLAALLREAALDRHSIDFLNPRRAPDLTARKRQVALAASFGVLMIGGTIYVLGDRKASELDDQIHALEKQRADLSTDTDHFLARHARFNNIKTWAATSNDWTDHLAVLAAQIPSGGTARLDELSGASATVVTPSPKGSTYDPACKWAGTINASFRLRGQVNSRDVATALRSRLLEGEIYVVDTQGAETADNFNVLLSTTVPAPSKFSKPKPKADAKPDTRPEAKPGTKAPSTPASPDGGAAK